MEVLRIVLGIRLRRRSQDPVRILDVNVIQESLRSDHCVRQDAAGTLRDCAARFDPF
jgi:hypothetical protein